MTVETGRTNDEVRHIEGKETVAIETTRVSLRQHKSFGNITFSIYVTKIGSCEEAVVTTGTQYQPSGVCTPIME